MPEENNYFATVEQTPEKWRVRLTRGVDQAGVLAALEEFQRLRGEAAARAVEIDVEGVTRQDHCAIALLRRIAEDCRGEGVEMRLAHAAPEVQESLQQIDPAAEKETEPERDAPLPLQIGEHTLGLLADAKAIFTFIGDLSYSIYLSVRHPRLVRWRDMFYYMDRTGSDAVPIVVMICFLMGLILGFQAAVQMHQFGADIYVADLVGLSIVMELGPLMVAMICTGRAGSAFAAEIGSMKVAEEVDALVTMGLDPNRFLVLPKVLALTAAMPLLTLFGDVAGIAGGFAVGMGQLGLPFVAYYSRTAAVISLWHIGQGLIKSVVFALLVSAVGCQRGLRAEGGAQGVGESTTSSVVSGIFLIVLADAMLTIVFNALG